MGEIVHGVGEGDLQRKLGPRGVGGSLALRDDQHEFQVGRQWERHSMHPARSSEGARHQPAQEGRRDVVRVPLERGGLGEEHIRFQRLARERAVRPRVRPRSPRPMSPAPCRRGSRCEAPIAGQGGPGWCIRALGRGRARARLSAPRGMRSASSPVTRKSSPRPPPVSTSSVQCRSTASPRQSNPGPRFDVEAGNPNPHLHETLQRLQGGSLAAAARRGDACWRCERHPGRPKPGRCGRQAPQQSGSQGPPPATSAAPEAQHSSCSLRQGPAPGTKSLAPVGLHLVASGLL